tara:strand:- start:4601 stop:5068 length:468 start_codon:yes stop_codon:yes gene_type:complete
MTKDQNDMQEPVPNRWQVLRDTVAFQFKLLMDGARDVLLSPISIGAAILGLIFSPDNPGIYFNRLMKFGRKTDAWINLFGASHYDPNSETRDSNDIDGKDIDSKDKARNTKKNVSSDAYVKKLENLLIAEYNKGGLIKDLKEGTDTLLEKLRKDQ